MKESAKTRSARIFMKSRNSAHIVVAATRIYRRIRLIDLDQYLGKAVFFTEISIYFCLPKSKKILIPVPVKNHAIIRNHNV